jgi:molybdopterin-containing oxidoreductase family iron-sulfur binding subunit
VDYKPVAHESGDLRTHLYLDKAEIIVCLDADLFGDHPAAVKLARYFAAGREGADGKMNRLYVVESCYSITGAMADHRLPIRSAEIASFVKALHQAISDWHKKGDDSEILQIFSGISCIIMDIVNSKDKSVVVAGGGQPKEVELLVRDINRMLGNIGKTVDYTKTPILDQRREIERLKSLVAEMNDGKINTLLILGGNPVYNCPADIDFTEAIKKVPASIHLSLYRNETSLQCAWHLPQAHFLESWGDAQAYDGAYCIVQPMIEPLHGGRSAIELLAMIQGGASTTTVLDLVQASAKEIFGTDDFEKRWRQVVHDGVLPGDALEKKDIAGLSQNRVIKDDESVKSPHPNPLPEEEGTSDGFPKGEGMEIENGKLEIIFRPSPAIYDGRFANNGWLQEMPDPLTRLTWDNAAVMSPATAAKLGVEQNTLVKLNFKGWRLEIPAYILPG